MQRRREPRAAAADAAQQPYQGSSSELHYTADELAAETAAAGGKVVPELKPGDALAFDVCELPCSGLGCLCFFGFFCLLCGKSVAFCRLLFAGVLAALL